jgi:hypothetical protein
MFEKFSGDVLHDAYRLRGAAPHRRGAASVLLDV